MAGKLHKARPTRRDAEDAAVLKRAGNPAHINAAEDRLLARVLPEAHGAVIKRGLLAEAGRRGDDRVTRLIPAEAELLKRRGGAGTRNPVSGLLEYYDGDDDDGNTSAAGENTGGMDTSNPNSGVTSDMGPSPSAGGNSGGYTSDFGGLGYRGYDARTMPSIESLLNTPSGYRAPGYEGLSMTQYSPPDTFGRLLDVFRYGPPPSYKALGTVPGRYGGPTGRGPGIMGTMVAQLTGQPMSAMMGLGMKFDQAMSPESRAASLDANQKQGAQNSGGRDHWTDDHRYTPGAYNPYQDARSGVASGAQTAELPQAPPGYTVNPAGQIVPMAGQDNNRPAWRDPAQNLIADYIWRGRTGRGFGWS